jgi:hypothetical protein
LFMAVSPTRRAACPRASSRATSSTAHSTRILQFLAHFPLDFSFSFLNAGIHTPCRPVRDGNGCRALRHMHAEAHAGLAGHAGRPAMQAWERHACILVALLLCSMLLAPALP